MTPHRHSTRPRFDSVNSITHLITHSGADSSFIHYYTIVYIQDGILPHLFISIDYIDSHRSRALPTLHWSVLIDVVQRTVPDPQDKERVSMSDDSWARLHLMLGLYLVLDSVLV